MKISIITATYNSADHIKSCLASVQNQSYQNIEHIIIDGASTDKTLEIIKDTPNRVVKIISEPDNGIYDALNKGIKQATGDIVCFLHADDLFASEKTLQKVFLHFKLSSTDVAYGDLEIIKKSNEDKLFRCWKSKAFHPEMLQYGWMPPHPALFIKKSLYNKIGGFDTSYKISGDYDFILRLFQQPGISANYIPEVLVRMQHGGASSKNLKNIIQKSREDLKALRENEIKYPYLTLAAKNLRKIPQFLK